MWARSTTITGNPQQMDEGMAYVRDTVMPEVQAMSGCVGLSMLGDRTTGRCIVTTAWADESSMHATEGMVHDLRARAAELMSGRPEVREWEIALLHRARDTPEGAFCRVVWTTGDPGGLDEMSSTFRMSLIPRIEENSGFCSTSLLIDRNSGMSATAVVFTDRQAADETWAANQSGREEMMRRAGREITDIGEFEVLLAHLRVPETV